jgi:hypothetical protein
MIIDYASPTPESTVPTRYQAPITLLISANLIAAAAIGFFGLIYADRLSGFSAYLIGACVIACIGILRFLTIQRPRFGFATFFLVIATLSGANGFLKCSAAYRTLRSEILNSSTQPIVIVYIETERGARLATLELTRTICGVYLVLSAVLLAYVIYRCLRPRPVPAI